MHGKREKSMKVKMKIMVMNKHERTTLYISNGGESAINEIYMNKINNGAIMKVSAKNPATAHILVR